MLNLIIVRHAKSDWSMHHQHDHERTLNERGRANAPFMGRILARNGVKPDKILSSTAIRAWETATAIAKELDYPEKEIVPRPDFYETIADLMIRAIHEFDPAWKTVLIFGHNNTWTELASRLSGTYIANIPTCGAVSIRFDAEDWSAIDAGNAQLEFFEFPKKYKPDLV